MKRVEKRRLEDCIWTAQRDLHFRCLGVEMGRYPVFFLVKVCIVHTSRGIIYYIGAFWFMRIVEQSTIAHTSKERALYACKKL